MNEKLPKVLVLGTNAWREDGTAHTLMEIFRCWDPERLALVYTRADYPNTGVCHKYFQISENEVVKSVLMPWKNVGKVVKNTIENHSNEVDKEHKRYVKAHKSKSDLLPLIREIIWKCGRWKSRKLKEFIKEFNPDIIFIPIYPTVYMGRIQRYISAVTEVPTVGYLADDNYSYDSCKSLWKYIHRFWLRHHVGPLVRNCKEMFVIVDKEKEDTDKRFGTDSVILTKGIDFTKRKLESHSPNVPLKFVYTGSLLIGRDESIALLADSINSLNDNGVKAELYIYSQTNPDEKVLNRINNRSSHFCGRISRERVLEVQRDADVVIFAEALKGKEAYAAKLSFSTKITDYLSNGKCILAIGREEIAPIDYFARNKAAIIASSENEIKEAVAKIIKNPEIISQYEKQAFSAAKRNHDIETLNKRFISTMLRSLKDG